jgi:hypothetical protein
MVSNPIISLEESHNGGSVLPLSTGARYVLHVDNFAKSVRHVCFLSVKRISCVSGSAIHRLADEGRRIQLHPEIQWE